MARRSIHRQPRGRRRRIERQGVIIHGRRTSPPERRSCRNRPVARRSRAGANSSHECWRLRASGGCLRRRLIRGPWLAQGLSSPPSDGAGARVPIAASAREPGVGSQEAVDGQRNGGRTCNGGSGVGRRNRRWRRRPRKRAKRPRRMPPPRRGRPRPQPAADERAPAKRVTLTAGVDFASAYMFRGIFQEDSGLIVPPYVDVGVSLYNGDGALKSVTVNGGMLEQPPLRAERQRQRLDRTQRVVRGGLLRVGHLHGRQVEAGRAVHVLHQPERRVRDGRRARGGSRLRRQRQHLPAESQGDPRLRAEGPGRRRRRTGGRRQQGHLPRARRPAGGAALSASDVSRHPGDSRQARDEPQRLLRGADRQQHLRLLRSRRHPQRAAGVHESQAPRGTCTAASTFSGSATTASC